MSEQTMDNDKKLFWNKYTIENIELAKKEPYWEIRQEAYRVLGYTEEAKKDKDYLIRFEAYIVLGFTEEAKKDKDSFIRREAELYFEIKKLKKLREKQVFN